MFGSARGVYQVYAWSSWVQDSVGSPLLAHYLVSFQPMEANSLQSYYLSIFMRIKGTGPCGWMKEWMNESNWSNMMKQMISFSMCGLEEFFLLIVVVPKIAACPPVQQRSLWSGRTLRHPLHVSIWRTALSVCQILNLSCPTIIAIYWNNSKPLGFWWCGDLQDPEYRFYTSANSYCPFGP